MLLRQPSAALNQVNSSSPAINLNLVRYICDTGNSSRYLPLSRIGTGLVCFRPVWVFLPGCLWRETDTDEDEGKQDVCYKKKFLFISLLMIQILDTRLVFLVHGDFLGYYFTTSGTRRIYTGGAGICEITLTLQIAVFAGPLGNTTSTQ